MIIAIQVTISEDEVSGYSARDAVASRLETAVDAELQVVSREMYAGNLFWDTAMSFSIEGGRLLLYTLQVTIMQNIALEAVARRLEVAVQNELQEMCGTLFEGELFWDDVRVFCVC